MKNSFFSFLFFGLFLTALISFADPQDTNKKSSKRNNTTIGDTSSTRRIEHNTTQPQLQKPDTPLIPRPTPPVPPPPVPRPDTTMH